MAKKQIKKIKKYFGHEMLGMEMDYGNFLLENGDLVSPEKIKEVKQTRVNPDVRKCFEEMAKVYQKKCQLEKEMKALNREMTDVRKEYQDFPNRIQEAKGFLRLTDFIEAFRQSLPRKLQDEIDNYGYEFGIGPCGPAQKAILIWTEQDIKKYYRGAMAYMEYDSTFSLLDDAEDTLEYKNYIRKYSCPLSVKKKPEEWLYLGDKDWLIYRGEYSIPIKKAMTRNYAEELAEKFVG